MVSQSLAFWSAESSRDGSIADAGVVIIAARASPAHPVRYFPHNAICFLLWLRLQGTLGFNIGCVNRGARCHEQTVALLAAKAQIGAGLRQVDLSDEIAVRRVAAHAVLLGIGPTHAAPNIAVDVGTHAVGKAGCEILGEHLSVAKLVAVDIEHAHVRPAAMGEAGIDDVKLLLVRRESKPVGLVEVIGHYGRLAASR